MKIEYGLVLFILWANIIFADATDPLIYTWVQSTGTGFGGVVNNIRSIKYSTDYVYINTGTIPAYSIGPFGKYTPSDQNYTFKFKRNPEIPTTKTKTPTDTSIGVWLNGVAIAHSNDGHSYNAMGIWKRNAYYWQLNLYDDCYGHVNYAGKYHSHLNPICLYDSTDSSSHSPIIGWSFDSYPIYGPFGYSNSESSDSAIRRILPSYKLRNITKRTTLPDGTVLASKHYGPDVSDSYPLGSYLEDYEYVAGYGDLDEYNGRWTVTPEYPEGTYAYFVGTDSTGNPTYPFSIGPYYYGSPDEDDIGSNAGHITISEDVTTYYAYSNEY